MKQEELNEILEQHKIWLYSDFKEGCRANLPNADLTEANLSNANLTGANLYRAYLERADLYRANLSYTNLTEANLSDANLTVAFLYNANLSNANLSNANLYRATLNHIKGKEILQFAYNRHTLIAFDNEIHIGCERHNIQYWLDNYKQIGINNGYTKEELEAYGDFIKYVAKLRGVE